MDAALEQGDITKNIWDYCQNPSPVVPTFYSFSKIHENSSKPPGYPIVSGRNTLTEKVSQVIDSNLRPHVHSLNSFIKDTIEFLRTIEDITFSPRAWLVSINVETLYSSIPHDLGIQAIAQFLKACDKSQWALNDFVLQALQFALRNNVFTFDDNIFLQTQDVTMGIPCVPSCATLYLGW